MIVSSRTRYRNTQSHIIGNRAGKYSRFCDHNVGASTCCAGCFFWPGAFLRPRWIYWRPGKGGNMDLRHMASYSYPYATLVSILSNRRHCTRRFQCRQWASPTLANTEPQLRVAPETCEGGVVRTGSVDKRRSGLYATRPAVGVSFSLGLVNSGRAALVHYFCFFVRWRHGPSCRGGQDVPDGRLHLSAAMDGYDWHF